VICQGRGLRDVECGGLNAVSRRLSHSPYGLSCVELRKLTCGEYEEEGCCGNWGKGCRRRGVFWMEEVFVVVLAQHESLELFSTRSSPSTTFQRQLSRNS
jgi:hypothetical protein